MQAAARGSYRCYKRWAVAVARARESSRTNRRLVGAATVACASAVSLVPPSAVKLDSSSPSSAAAHLPTEELAQREYRRYEQTMREALQGDNQELYDRAIQQLAMSAKHGYAPGQFALASLFARPGPGQDLDHAREWLRLAAQQEHREAQFSLANFLYRGLGSAKPDLLGAAQWFERAAQNGSSEAQYMLAMQFIEGQGVQKNVAQGLVHLQTAAQSGYLRAMNNLGMIYMTGARDADDGGGDDEQLVSPNPVEAARWWRMASDKGFAEASFNLGVLLGQGSGTGAGRGEGRRNYEGGAAAVAAGCVERDEAASKQLLETCIAQCLRELSAVEQDSGGDNDGDGSHNHQSVASSPSPSASTSSSPTAVHTLLNDARQALSELETAASRRATAEQAATTAAAAAAVQEKRQAKAQAEKHTQAKLREWVGLPDPSRLSWPVAVGLNGGMGAASGAAIGFTVVALHCKVHGMPLSRPAATRQAALFAVVFGVGSVVLTAAQLAEV